jgi:hypothetical protein
MPTRASRTTYAAILLGTVHCAAAQPPAVEDELEQLKETLTRRIDDNLPNAGSFNTNGFRVEAAEVEELGADFTPSGERFEMLSVTAGGMFEVLVEKGRSISQGGGVAILHRLSGQPIVSTGDGDGDGLLDSITYSKLDEDGKALVTVIDYEADGQPDVRFNSAAGYTEIWHVDRWLRIERRGEQRGVILNGEFIELERQGNRRVVPRR